MKTSKNYQHGGSNIGYVSDVSQEVGQMHIYNKYMSCNVPVMCRELTGGGKNKIIKENSSNLINKTNVKHCQQIGGEFNTIVAHLAEQLAPLGSAGVAELVVIMSMYYLGHQKKLLNVLKRRTSSGNKSKQKKHSVKKHSVKKHSVKNHSVKNHSKGKGGGLDMIATLSQTLLPLGLEGLTTLASLLLIHHAFTTMRVKTKNISKKQHGGALDLILQQVLSPEIGVPLLLLTLQQWVVSSRTNSRKPSKKSTQKGGCDCDDGSNITNQSGGMVQLGSLIAPYGINQFSAGVLLFILNKMFNNTMIKNKTKKQTQKGGMLFHELQYLLMPSGVNPFLTLITLLLLGVKMHKRKQSKK